MTGSLPMTRPMPGSSATPDELRRLCGVVARRGKLIRLTPKGEKAQQKYRRLLRATEESWRTRFGADAIELIPGGSVMRRVVSEIRAALTELRKQQMAHEGITQQDIAETMPE